MYNPPSETNWFCVSRFNEQYAIAYDRGYNSARDHGKLDGNPYKPSGHERDSSFEDELHYQWYSGFCSFEDDK